MGRGLGWLEGGGVCLHLRPRGSGHAVRHLPQIDPPHQVHLARVDLQDVKPGGLVGVGELDLAIDPARPQQRRVQDVNPVGRHQHLQQYVARWVDTLWEWYMDLKFFSKAAGIKSPSAPATVCG